MPVPATVSSNACWAAAPIPAEFGESGAEDDGESDPDRGRLSERCGGLTDEQHRYVNRIGDVRKPCVARDSVDALALGIDRHQRGVDVGCPLAKLPPDARGGPAGSVGGADDGDATRPKEASEVRGLRLWNLPDLHSWIFSDLVGGRVGGIIYHERVSNSTGMQPALTLGFLPRYASPP